jgi:hypothetical protein
MKMFRCTFVQDKVTHQSLRGSVQKIQHWPPTQPGVEHASRGKAAAVFTRGAYAVYVSTEKWRERRWRLFSTDPEWMSETGLALPGTCGTLAENAFPHLNSFLTALSGHRRSVRSFAVGSG